MPEVTDERSHFDFTDAISAIDSDYASIQEYFLYQKVKNHKKLPEFYDLIEDFRNHHCRTEALKPLLLHSVFATLRRESQETQEP